MPGPVRTITVPENGAEILVYPDGLAVLSPGDSRLSTVWQEQQGEGRMHHVIGWKAHRPGEAAS